MNLDSVPPPSRRFFFSQNNPCGMGDHEGLCTTVKEQAFEAVAVKSEEMRQMASTAASSPWSRNNSPMMGATGSAACQDKLLWRVLLEANMCRDADRDIIEILSGTKFGAGNRQAPVKRQLEESDQDDSSNSDVDRSRPVSTVASRNSDKRPYGAAVVVSGCCQHCGTEVTPQWRYVHREKFCNACYMRIKRWVHSHLSARKLPSRARMDISEEDDHHFTQQAREIVQLALESLGSPH